MDNILLLTDSYKTSHYNQYPPGTELIYSYLESRGGCKRNVFFGLQYILKKYLVGPVVTLAKINEAEEIINAHMGTNLFPRDKWMHILEKHGGHLPIRIAAAPEGSVIDPLNVLMSIENTDPACYWLTNYLESILMQVWYPTTVATQSFWMKDTIRKGLQFTGGDLTTLDFKLHDFGFRGVSSVESAAIGGAAHLVNFKGTDNMAALTLLRDYYGAVGVAGYSIPATEHSTITSWGKKFEPNAIRNFLEKNPNGTVACVSDSFNIYDACEKIYGSALKRLLISRNGCLVIRPDCYDDQTEILTETGWKLFANLKPEEKVAQYTPDKYIEFIVPSNYVNQHYDGDMIHISSKRKRIDLLVTPNHRMVRLRNDNTIDIQLAESVKYNYLWKHPGSGYKKGVKNSLTYLERLYIAFQADGSFNSSFDGELKNNRVCLRFNFTKQRKVKRLLDICIKGKFEHKVSIEESRPLNTQVYVWLDHLPPKTLDWIKLDEISSDWGCEFLEEISHWDATRRHSTRFKYDSVDKFNVDVVQSIATLSGCRTCYTKTVDNRQQHFSDVHTLHCCTFTDTSDTQNFEKTTKTYNGRVYCVTVPSGMLVVRRNGVVSISGNSGNPVEVIPRILGILEDKFGKHVNEAGWKTLPKFLRIIQGDGIDANAIAQIIQTLKEHRWSTDVIAFGSGGGLLQKLNRDTYKFAIKCSLARVNGVDRDVYKDPITDSGKKSKRGRQWLLRLGNKYPSYLTANHADDMVGNPVCELKEVFRDGILKVNDNLEDIRNRTVIEESEEL